MPGKTATKRCGTVESGMQGIAKQPEVFYRIHSLLYTLRAIAQREDQLCMLMHHLRTAGKLNAALTAELQKILEEIPAEEYLHDLEALRASMEAVSGAPVRTKARIPTKRRAA